MCSNLNQSCCRIMILCLLGFLSACNFHFREAPETFLLGPSEAGCLSETGTVLSRYFEGNSSEREISSFWQCLDKSLQLFSEGVRGAEPGIYKADELRDFLEKYFLKDKRISDNLLNELMELKRTLLGGNSSSLTLEELKRTRQFFQVLNEQMALLQPFMPLTPEWAIGQNASVLDSASAALESAAQMIGGTLEKTGYAYHISHLEELRKAIEGILSTGASAISLKIHQRMPLLRAAKALLIAPPGDRINGNEWVTFLTTTSKWYSIVLRASHLQMNYETLLMGAGRERAVNIAQEILNLLTSAAERHPDSNISFGVLDDLVDALNPSELFLPCPDAASTAKNRKIIKSIIRAFVQRVLAGPDFTSTGRGARGLGIPALLRASEMIESWSEGQRYLEKLFQTVEQQRGNDDSGTLGYYPQELLYYAADNLLDDPKPTTPDAIAVIRDIIKTFPPLFAADESEISFSVAAPLRRHSFSNLSKIHIAYELADIVLTSYASDPARALERSGITAGEFYKAFLDIEHLGYAKKLFDPDRDNYLMIQTRFREGSLFTYASDGDEYLNSSELTQLFTFMYSNFKLADRIHLKITAACGKEPGGLGPDDVFGRPSISIGCYRRELFGNLTLFLKRLPDMANYYERLGHKQKVLLEKSLEISARLPNSPPQYMGLNDSLGFSGTFQFIEAVFRRFDKTHPRGMLNYQESTAAFPVFQRAIQQVVKKRGVEKQIQPADYEGLFTYLLAFGRAPEANFEGVFSWLWWKEKKHFGLHWNIDADRLSLAQIFAELSK